jgi:hypothetical protein
MRNNSQSGPRSTLRRDPYWYFDRLPKRAREAFANATFDWSAGELYLAWSKGRITLDRLIASVQQADAKVIARDKIRKEIEND